MSFQQMTLVGNLGNDPEMRYTPSGVPVTSFSLAVNRTWTNQEGQKQEKTIWFKVTAWRKLAETVSQYATKGQQVLVVGELEEPRTFTDRDGNMRVSLDVTAQTVRFLGRRDGAAGHDVQPADRHENGGASGAHSSTQSGEDEIPF
jgi:single-strand DNA-binding protein